MKIRIIYASLLVINLIFLSSCEKFLEEKPKDRILIENGFLTKNDVISFTNGFYNQLAQFYRASNNEWNAYQLIEPRCDDMLTPYGSSVGTSPQRNSHLFDLYTVTPSTSNVLTAWQNMYAAIKDCNVLIKKAPEAAQADSVVKAFAIGQATFFRAYWHFNLVRLWGDVPLITKQLESESEAMLPRTPAKLVYDQIVKDLEFCVDSTKSGLKKYYTSSSDIGRITLGAARTLLAEVYMTKPEKNYARAAELLKMTIDENTNTLFPNYFDVFLPAAKNASIGNYKNGENIFLANCDQDIDPPGGTGICFVFMPYTKQVGTNIPSGRSGWGYLAVSSALYNLYENGDLRKNGNFPATFINRTGVVENYPHNPGVFYYLAKYSAAGQVFGGNWTRNPMFIYRYADVLLLFAEAQNEAKNGPDAAAYNAINQVRRRAFGVNQYTPSTYDLQGLNKADFKTAVINEARKELVGDARRLWYELRLGTLVEDLRAINQNIDATKVLLPIPQQELDLNPNLVQNPGY